ncbi:hypothetical protein KOR42_23390 [Thalassoglobus neptunius]|uniref:Uncharacterized protein n=1 Tax=Thalassoglobus neptunius TaxID=1938619 RepID=A0A5C5XAP9_9PLAN|nr:hypothetical protein [Thalassoglobus neptunius]TWT58952.1 hypothetical protein KOR42_23390 [Thalassoglobus neptunius]
MKISRRAFFARVQVTALKWSQLLGLMGFRLKMYGAGVPGYSASISFLGRCVGFLTKDGHIQWLSQLK